MSGPGAITVDPTDVNGLARAMAALVEDDGARERAHSRGLEWVRRFSWERAARETEAVYETVQRRLAERSETLVGRAGPSVAHAASSARHVSGPTIPSAARPLRR